MASCPTPRTRLFKTRDAAQTYMDCGYHAFYCTAACTRAKQARAWTWTLVRRAPPGPVPRRWSFIGRADHALGRQSGIGQRRGPARRGRRRRLRLRRPQHRHRHHRHRADRRRHLRDQPAHHPEHPHGRRRPGAPGPAAGAGASARRPNDQMAKFVSTVLADTEDVWTRAVQPGRRDLHRAQAGAVSRRRADRLRRRARRPWGRSTARPTRRSTST